MRLQSLRSWLRWLTFFLASTFLATAAEYHGRVSFNDLPVPGASITLIQDGHKISAVSNAEGFYSFPNVPDGAWTIEIQMSCFAPIKQNLVISGNTPAGDWHLEVLPLDQIRASIEQVKAAPPVTPSKQPETAETHHDFEQDSSAEGFLVNGSLNNGAASLFSQAAAFGNNRNAGKSLYNGGIGILFDNSALDARPFSLTGQETPKPTYNQLEGVLSLGGPIRIPHLLKNGPMFVLNYQWTRNHNVTTQPALMPTAAQRSGEAEGIPVSRISPQARALLSYYPLPNFNESSGYNYQVPIKGAQHQDALQTRLDKIVGARDEFYGRFAFQSTRTDTPNVFGFLDTSDTLGFASSVNWSHRFGQQLFMNTGYQFSRLSMRTTPFFENRENVSGEAGISGNDQSPANWGPPTLVFSSGLASLTDAQSSFDRNQTDGVTYAMYASRNNHNILFGGGFRRQQFNYLSQQNPRGTFTFTGQATGSDFGGFLLGIPDTSAIAFGNADKYFRESVYDTYLTDDWRVTPGLTVNAGLRWDYGSPISELYNRLVNLDIVPGFTAAEPVLGSQAVGPLTGQNYPRSLIRPDRSGFEPRIGMAWRPISGSSLVVRLGYGIYYNTSVYQTIALEMAQQAPLSKSLRVQNSAETPLTLANGFNAAGVALPNTFAIDPNFRVGYAQNWQAAIQRDLPGSLQMTVTYLGIKGTHAMQDFLPNTYPEGARNPCPECPSGFEYVTSNANSSREAAQIQLRRRLHSGLTALLQYTFSKSIDDAAALGGGGNQGSQTNANNPQNPGSGPNSGSQNGSSTLTSAASPLNLAIAQNWLDLTAERGLSSFDQRHALSAQIQYTTGMGLRGGTLLSGWKGALLKEWTFASDITASSGLPLTPVYLTAVQGTGVTGTIRPNYTGAPLYNAPPGLYLNPAAYSIPLPGQWGNAGRNTITGPSQFLLNASLGRTFRLNDRLNLDLRFDSTNALNRVNFTAWNTTIGNPQFGLPSSANAMRSVETVLRLRF